MACENLKKTEVTIRRRVECEEKAFHIVNKLVDGCEDSQYLSECGKRINQANYDDVVEERSIIKLCGYPLCNQALPNVPKKKYHISTKTNKVYDISERKKFCSNQCYKASNIFKKQIPESPVWGRDEDKIDIVVSPHKGVRGQVGEEVIGEKPQNNLQTELEQLQELDKRFVTKHQDTKEEFTGQENDKNKVAIAIQSEKEGFARENACSSDPGKTHAFGVQGGTSVEDIQSDAEKLHFGTSELRESKSPKTHALEFTSKSKECNESLISNSETSTNIKHKGERQPQPLSKLEQLQKLLNKRKNILSDMVDLQEFKENKSTKDNFSQCNDSGETVSEKIPHNSKKVTNSGKNKSIQRSIVRSPLNLICQVLKKWISVNTVEYLQFKTSIPESVDPVAKKFSDLQIQVDCANLSQNLDIREKELSTFLGNDISSDGGDQKEKKNIPDYNLLKTEADQFQLKVTEFITGKKPKQDNKVKDDDDLKNAVCIPTVDTYDQSQIRAKIVLERLDKSLPDLLIPMGLSVQDVSTRVRELIYTFRLDRDTIIFKPAEWTLVSLLLLKMLSFNAKAIEEAFNKNSTIRHFSILLKGIHHTVEDIDVFAREILSEATVTFEPF